MEEQRAVALVSVEEEHELKKLEVLRMQMEVDRQYNEKVKELEERERKVREMESSMEKKFGVVDSSEVRKRLFY